MFLGIYYFFRRKGDERMIIAVRFPTFISLAHLHKAKFTFSAIQNHLCRKHSYSSDFRSHISET